MIQNAFIVGANTRPERYEAEEAPRGTPPYVLRSHDLSEILRNAQRWVKGYKSPESKALKYGSIWDCLLLVPFQWPERYAVIPADAPKRPSKTQINAKKPSPDTIAAIEWWNTFTKRNPGEIVSQDVNASVHAAIKRLREDKLIAELLDCSARQVMISAEWVDHQTGLIIPLKALIDVVPDPEHPIFGNSVWDCKTTQNASPRSFARDAQKYAYHVQAGFYIDMLNACQGSATRSDFGHVVQESYPPYEYRTPPPLLTQRFLGFGRLCYQRALAIYCKAMSTGVWPSYDPKGKDWPLTDCDDWFLSSETLYDDILEDTDEEPEEMEIPNGEAEKDLIP